MSTDTATLLGEHEAVQFSLISLHGPWHLTCSCEGWSCECDDPMALDDGECITDGQHRAHLAAVIDAHTAQVVREAAEKALLDLAVRVENLRRRNPMNGDGFNSAIDMVIARLGDEATLAAQAERARLDDEYTAHWYPRADKEADRVE